MKILNVRVDSITEKEALDALENRQLIFTPNPEIILEAKRNKAFRRALKRGSMMLPDGHGLLFVSTLLRIKSKILRFVLYLPMLLVFLVWKKPFKNVLPEVIHGSDFMSLVVEWAAGQNKSVFFLGGRDKDGVAKKTSEYFKAQFPSLRIAGFSSLDPSHQAYDLIKKTDAEVLFVAYGAPKQEMWLSKYAHKLPKLHTAMGVGGSFDFWSGKTRRAPVWMRKSGLEWLFRVYLDPRGRLKRIWNALVRFPVTSLFFS